MKKTLFLISVIVLISPGISFAQTTTPATPAASNPSTSAVPAGQNEFIPATPATSQSYSLLAPLPSLDGKGGVINSVTIQGYVLYIFKIVIAVAVLLAVVMVTWGGFKYMTVESVTGKSDAKQIIENAILGLLGALGSYLILYTINPQLVNLNLIAVPKLNISVDPNNLNIAQLNSQLNQINSQTAAATAQAATLNQQAAADNTKVVALKNEMQLSGNCDETNPAFYNKELCDNYTAQIQAAQTTADSSLAKASTNIAISELSTGTARAINTTGLASAADQNAIDAVNTRLALNQQIANDARAKLPNGDIVDKNTITDNLNFSQTQLLNQISVLNFQKSGQYNIGNVIATKNAINDQTNAAIAQLSNNPALQQQLRSSADQMLSKINTK